VATAIFLAFKGKNSIYRYLNIRDMNAGYG